MKILFWEAILLLHILILKPTYEQHCLIPTDNICTCCQTGYIGFNCSQLCQNCESRILHDGRCNRKCASGYYGKECQTECSKNCEVGNSGKNICNRNDGSCINGCIQGRFGEQCNLFCNKNCYDFECTPKDGFCNGCKDQHFYDKHCSVPCAGGCINGTCKGDGTCLGGCKYNVFGEKCITFCGHNCKSGCTHDTASTFKCTNGCRRGYSSTNCTERCPDNCEECEQFSGRCKILVQTSNETVLIILLVLLAIVIFVVVIIVVFYVQRKRNRRRKDNCHRRTESNKAGGSSDIECANLTSDALLNEIHETVGGAGVEQYRICVHRAEVSGGQNILIGGKQDNNVTTTEDKKPIVTYTEDLVSN